MKKPSLYPLLIRTISLLTICLFLSIAQAQDPGFFLNEWQEKTAKIPTYELVNKPVGAASVTIHVDVNQKLNKVPSYIYGNNAVVWGGNMNEHNTVMTDIKNLDPHVLRWPGGNLSQEYFWNRSAIQCPDDVITLSYSGSSVMNKDSIPLIPFSDVLVDNLLPGDSVSAIETTLIPKISVYPNPVREMLTIELGNQVNDVLIQIVNLLGQPVYVREYRALEHYSKIELNMSYFQKGIYLIRIVHDKGRYHHPIIVE